MNIITCFRMPEEMRKRIESCAQQNVRTVTGEINYRLKQSFEREDKQMRATKEAA